MGNFKEDIARCEAFVFDVDGVFTDGGITPFGDDFIRRYYAKDGYAVSYASKLGYKICIITGGRGKWLQERFERLRVTKIYADCADKIAALREFLDEYGLDARNVVFMGDDIPDLECMRAVGIPVGSRSRRFAGKYGSVAAVKTAAVNIRRITRENRQRGDGYHD